MQDLFVIKVGGNVIDDEQKLLQFASAFASIQAPKILVHGGGKLATRVAQSLGIQQQMVEGRRITDAETLKVVTMVYAGYVNKNVVGLLQAEGCNAIGLSGADGNLVRAHKRTGGSGIGKAGVDYGYAGDVDEVNASLIELLLNASYTPVLAPITHNAKGQLLNTNADTIASATAVAMSQYFRVHLLYCFEKPGVLLDVNDDDSVIAEINPEYYDELMTEGKLFEGIIPKIDNAFSAIKHGVTSVLIGHADDVVVNTSSSPVCTRIYSKT